MSKTQANGRIERRWLATLLAAAVVYSPGLAIACSVCSSGREDETRLAFILTTGFLTVMPLILVGAVVWWLVRRARQEAAEERPPGQPTTPAHGIAE